MKKVLMFVALFFASPVFGASLYDGAWDTPGPFFASFHQNGSQILMLVLQKDGSEWEAAIGSISGNTATASSVLSSVNFQVRVVFQSATQGLVTILSCIPQSECTFPAGTQITITKIF